MDDAQTVGGGQGVPEDPAEGSPPQEPADVAEPALGGPKDDPQEAIAAHSGMWWPPAIEPEEGEASGAPAGSDPGHESPPESPQT